MSPPLGEPPAGCAPLSSTHLALGALQVAGDEGVLGPVQHGADLLAQLEGRRPDQPGGLPPDPDEHVGPAVQDVHPLSVQQGLQLEGGERQRALF